jgi:hypothetical protein
VSIVSDGVDPADWESILIGPRDDNRIWVRRAFDVSDCCVLCVLNSHIVCLTSG